MGTVVSKATSGVGAAIGSAFAAPIKSIFGGSCEGVCAGTWDLPCFIEHLCVFDLVKLVMVFGLTYITLMFFYLLFKLGIFQCIGRSLCKMGWAACETYWYAVESMTCFLWHKLTKTKRVYRGHRGRLLRDVEQGYSLSEDDNNSIEYYNNLSLSRRRKSFKERRKDHLQRSLYLVKHGSKRRHRSLSHRHNVQLSTNNVSVRLHDGSARIRNSRHLQVRRNGYFKR